MQENREQTPHSDIRYLLGMLEATGNAYDFDKIRRAFDLAARLHAGQFRASGEPYITHPIAVTELLADFGLDTDSICAALLHDVVEDCSEKVSLDDIRNGFGEDVAQIVDGLTKIVPIDVSQKEEAHMKTVRKMFLAMAKDIRVIIIKLCDRLHNMRTLSAKHEAKQRSTSLETMHIYAPLAHRLGIQTVKCELEDLCIRYLDPIGYRKVEEGIARYCETFAECIENARLGLSSKLSECGIPYSIEGVMKPISNVYDEVFHHNNALDSISDICVLRVTVDTESECYAVLKMLHEMYRPVPECFYDYIASPKPNMYESLHTTVIGQEKIPFEVQICTLQMYRIANYGVVAHWKYQTDEQVKHAYTAQKLAWISRLIETESSNLEAFLRALREDVC